MVSQTPAERRADLLARIPEWQPKAIHEWLFQIADEYPDREFIVTDDETFTYREVVERVERVASALYDRGLRKGDHIAVLMANYPEYAVLKYAISRLGGVMVPLNFAYKQDELGWVLKNSEAKAFIVMTEFRGSKFLEFLDRIAPGWEDGGELEALPHLTHVVQFKAQGEARPGVETFAELEASGSRLPSDAPQADPSDVSIIFYTSGSTGNPKGVLWTHDQDGRAGYGAAMVRAFADGWRGITALPYYHAFANNDVLNAPMFVGGAVIPRLLFDGDDILDAIERHRANEFSCVPTMLVGVLEAAEKRETDTSSLIALLAAGAIAPVWQWEKAIELLGVSELTTGYGATETGGGPVMSPPEEGIDLVTTSVGKIKFAGPAGLPDQDGRIAEVRTADVETGEILPFGVEGEIIIRGPGNAKGYWKRPEEDAVTFRGEWVYSGDVGIVTEDHVVKMTGRKKEMIRSGGENYAPKEVEDLLSSHETVSQAYVVGLPDDKWGEIGCAWVVPSPGAQVDHAELEQLCRDNLAGFKRPRQFRTLLTSELPLTSSGKVQKFKLVERAIGEPQG